MGGNPNLKAGPGRRALPEAERLTRTVCTRVTDAEYDAIRGRAAEHGTTMSEYGRAALLGKTVRGQVNRSAAYELRRIGNNLNQMAHIANATYRLASEAEIRRRLDSLDRVLEVLL